MSAPETLPDLLAEAGIRLRRQTPGTTQKVVCPRCEGGRTKEACLSVTIDADGAGATWKCHRGHCGWTAGRRVAAQEGRRAPLPPRQPRPVQKPAPHASTPRPRALYAFFEGRGISADTVDHFGCYVATRFIPSLGERPCIVFPYRFKGEVANRKYRPPEKQPQAQEKDALPTLFNVDSVIDPETWVVWVEGEPDVMACHEAGYLQVVTLKDGAGDKLREEDDPRRLEDRRFAALATHAELLAGVKRFILAADDDDPGKVLREELARRLGRHRCWLAAWPDGCKDAGDVLRQHGAGRLRDCLAAATPFPIEGIQRLRPGTLLRLRHSPPPPVLTTGTRSTDAVLKLPGEGRLIVITGLPNAGKSVWTLHTSIHLMRAHQRRFLVFSPEMQPWEHYAALCSQVLIEKPFWPAGAMIPSMTDAEIESAEAWLRERVIFLVSDAEEDAPTLDWILDRARVSVLREGVTDLLIDPWNEVEHQRADMTETEYVGRSLQRARAFGFRHGCNVWIVAHPKVQTPAKPGGQIAAPGLYDISGGANWANKADVGITVHTPGNETEIHVTKARFRRWGRKGTSAKLDHDPLTGCYYSPVAPLLGEEP